MEGRRSGTNVLGPSAEEGTGWQHQTGAFRSLPEKPFTAHLSKLWLKRKEEVTQLPQLTAGLERAEDGAQGSPQTLPWRTLATGTACDSLQRTEGRAALVPRPMGEEPGEKSHLPWKGAADTRSVIWRQPGHGSPWRPLARMLAPSRSIFHGVQRKTEGRHLEFCSR